MNENIINAYKKINNITRERLSNTHGTARFGFRESYVEEPRYLSDNNIIEKNVSNFIDTLVMAVRTVTDETSMLDFLRLTAEQGKTLPDEYKTLKMIAGTAEQAIHSDNFQLFLDKAEKTCDIAFSFFLGLVKDESQTTLFKKMFALNHFLETFAIAPSCISKDECYEDCLKMVDVAVDFYHECLENENYADFTTFFAIYCSYYIIIGLDFQLEWSDDYIFGIPKNMFSNADTRLLPYLEKIHMGILSIYQKGTWYDFNYLNNYYIRNIDNVDDMLEDYNYMDNDLLNEIKDFQAAIEIWSDLPIANYYCFIRTAKNYFDFYSRQENFERELSGIVVDLGDEIHYLERIPKEERTEEINQQLIDKKEKCNYSINKYNNFIQRKDCNEYAELLTYYYGKLPKEYRERAIILKMPKIDSVDNYEPRNPSFDLPLPIMYISKENEKDLFYNPYYNQESIFKLLKFSTSSGRESRLGMRTMIQYPNILAELLLNDKQKLAEQNKALKKAQEDRAKVINEFSHTYKNMRATSLLEVANALMATGDPNMIQHGRTVLLEYGVKQTLTKDVEMLQLRFEDEIEELQKKIRKSVLPNRTEKTQNLHQLLSNAFKRCLITTVHDSDERMDAMRWGFIGFEPSLDILCERFENEILFVPNGNVFDWFSSNILPISCVISPSWENLHFLENSYAALMVTDLIAELTANMFKYSDKSKKISYSFTETDDLLFITIQNYTAPDIEKSADGGVGLISKSETLKLLNEAGKLEKEAITTEETEDGLFTTTVILSKQVFASMPEQENE